MQKIWDVGNEKDSLHVPGPMLVLDSPPITGNMNSDTHSDAFL